MTETAHVQPALDPDEVGRVVEELFPEALGVWLYGSFADGYARADSDIDIAILADRPIDGWSLFERAQNVALRLHREVDLVDLRSVPPLLQFEVLANGRRVAERDATTCDYFEMTAISAYQRLLEERREIFEAIAERGSIR